MCNTNTGVIVLGKIDLDNNTMTFDPIVCNECGEPVNMSHGDTRTKVVTRHSDGSTSVKWICDFCENELFGDHQPNSIFE